MAVQEGLTNIKVSWSPPTPLGDTTGYRIYYSDSSDSVDVSGGSTDNYLLTGLQNGHSYTTSIVATSQHLPSETVTLDMSIGLGEISTVYYHYCVPYTIKIVIGYSSPKCVPIIEVAMKNVTWRTLL